MWSEFEALPNPVPLLSPQLARQIHARNLHQTGSTPPSPPPISIYPPQNPPTLQTTAITWFPFVQPHIFPLLCCRSMTALFPRWTTCTPISKPRLLPKARTLHSRTFAICPNTIRNFAIRDHTAYTKHLRRSAAAAIATLLDGCWMLKVSWICVLDKWMIWGQRALQCVIYIEKHILISNRNSKYFNL